MARRLSGTTVALARVRAIAAAPGRSRRRRCLLFLAAPAKTGRDSHRRSARANLAAEGEASRPGGAAVGLVARRNEYSKCLGYRLLRRTDWRRRRGNDRRP